MLNIGIKRDLFNIWQRQAVAKTEEESRFFPSRLLRLRI
jgi:hypothetical protein